jgi:hypothetical protein
MHAIRDRGDCWPTWRQELLLRAALLRGTDAISAWEKWKSSVDIDHLDPGSNNLLPLLYHNLGRHGIEDPSINRLKGVYRQTWYKNQLSMQTLSALLTTFHNAGIQTMVLKGAALLLLYYRNYGLRPMGDIDVLVHVEQAGDAVDLMMKSGWIPGLADPHKYISLSHAIPFESPTAHEAVDLHWHVFHEGRHSEVDDNLWKEAISVNFARVSTTALSPTDQLLHAFAHGVKWSPIPPFRWVADSTVILNDPNAGIDWERLLRLTSDYRLVLPVRHGLTYLKERFDAPVPEEVLHAFEHLSTSRMERIEFRYKTRNYERKVLGRLPVLWFDQARLMRDEALPRRLFGFLRYLHGFWGAASPWQFPFCVMSQMKLKARKILDYYGKRLRDSRRLLGTGPAREERQAADQGPVF